MFSCLIPESMLTNAPVDDVAPSAAAYRQPMQRPAITSQQPFQGQGMKLGMIFSHYDCFSLRSRNDVV